LGGLGSCAATTTTSNRETTDDENTYLLGSLEAAAVSLAPRRGCSVFHRLFDGTWTAPERPGHGHGSCHAVLTRARVTPERPAGSLAYYYRRYCWLWKLEGAMAAGLEMVVEHLRLRAAPERKRDGTAELPRWDKESYEALRHIVKGAVAAKFPGIDPEDVSQDGSPGLLAKPIQLNDAAHLRRLVRRAAYCRAINLKRDQQKQQPRPAEAQVAPPAYESV